jgi:hypothetical protein
MEVREEQTLVPDEGVRVQELTPLSDEKPLVAYGITLMDEPA